MGQTSRLDLRRKTNWAEARLPRVVGIGGQRRRRRCGRRFSPLDATMRAGMDAGDGSGHRRHFVVVDLGFTGV
ncbi:hypothetical protein CRG98_006031 [Punica granatum]|uniref:Uncharacterized protein n=1 Tax=Punica granatum TaxID=22663 RepID=A0A2I0KZ05_PUNGR|nr:hypothetical protein CRG98_006031 [Punica granatum]